MAGGGGKSCNLQVLVLCLSGLCTDVTVGGGTAAILRGGWFHVGAESPTVVRQSSSLPDLVGGCHRYHLSVSECVICDASG